MNYSSLDSYLDCINYLQPIRFTLVLGLTALAFTSELLDNII